MAAALAGETFGMVLREILKRVGSQLPNHSS
jgi:hypothetical protein